MTITIVSATPFEVAPMINWLNNQFNTKSEYHFEKEGLTVLLLITGVGMTMTAFHMGRHLERHHPDWLMQVGIAGSFTDQFSVGTVVNVVADRFADLGVEEADGSFIDVHEMDLIPADASPFDKGWLHNTTSTQYDFLPKATGITVNKVHGTKNSIEKIRDKYDPQIETMEGAAFHYACLVAKKPFLQIRGISNKVEPRDRENWDLPKAIERSNEVGIQILTSLLEARSARQQGEE